MTTGHDGVCEACGAPFDTCGGIATSVGYVCYECIPWIHRVAAETQTLAPRDIGAILSDIDGIE